MYASPPPLRSKKCANMRSIFDSCAENAKSWTGSWREVDSTREILSAEFTESGAFAAKLEAICVQSRSGT